jgi:hypothetical protein
MTTRLAMRCSCGMEFTVPGNVSIGALVPCPRCAQTLRVSSVPVAKATARPAASHAQAHDRAYPSPAYRGPRKRLGVPAAPGHVSIRSDQSEVLVNYGLWTLLFGIFSTLTPLLPIQHHAWDSFISYQPYGGIIIATCGVMMMIVYQSGPDFARGPGAPMLVAAFWMVGVTMAVFSGWVADRVRQRSDDAAIAAAKAPVIEQQSPPLQRFNRSDAPPPQNSTPTSIPVAQAPTITPSPRPTETSSTPPITKDNPFGIPPDDVTTNGKEASAKRSDPNRNLASVKEDLSSKDKRRVLTALEEVLWYYQRAERDDVEQRLVVLLSLDDEDVLLATLMALKTWGDTAAEKAIVPLISHESPSIRTAAIALVGKFRNPKGLAAVVDRLEEDTDDAKAALLRVGKSATDALRQGLKSKSKKTRLECVKIIGQIDARPALAQLRAMAEHDKDDEVRGEARRVAEQLATKK